MSIERFGSPFSSVGLQRPEAQCHGKSQSECCRTHSHRLCELSTQFLVPPVAWQNPESEVSQQAAPGKKRYAMFTALTAGFRHFATRNSGVIRHQSVSKKASAIVASCAGPKAPRGILICFSSSADVMANTVRNARSLVFHAGDSRVSTRTPRYKHESLVTANKAGSKQNPTKNEGVTPYCSTNCRAADSRCSNSAVLIG